MAAGQESAVRQVSCYGGNAWKPTAMQAGVAPLITAHARSTIKGSGAGLNNHAIDSDSASALVVI